MSESELSSIPLPSLANMGKGPKKTAKEMLQDALRVTQKDKKVSKAEDASSTIQSKAKEGSKSAEKSSQSIVDELFKDFIAQKFNKVPGDQPSTETSGKNESSVDEISKILDMEISSIQNNSEVKEEADKKLSEPKSVEDKAYSSKHHHKLKKAKRSRSEKDVREKKAKKRKRSSSPKLLAGTSIKNSDDNIDKMKDTVPLKAIKITSHQNVADLMNKQEPPQSLPQTETVPSISSAPKEVSNIDLPQSVRLESELKSLSNTHSETDSVEVPSQIESATEDKDISEDKSKTGSGLMLPAPLAKKQAIPKQLGLKLTSTSLSLIKSNDRVDQDGRVWEEGEVVSSHSENEQDDSESEPDGYPSETGSINSNAEDWRDQVHKSKKRHKHKHKKKKKKSSGKDKEKGSKSSSEKSNSQDSKHGKTLEKRSSVDRKSRERSRSKSREDSKRNKDNRNSKEPDNHRRRPRSRSKSPKSHRSSRKSRSRSRSPKRSRYDEWDARQYSSKSKHRSRSRSRGRSSERSKTSSSSGHNEDRKKKETREQRLQIDKAKLRRIAIANALVNMKAGQGPQVETPAVKNEGKSVQELTEFCKKIAEKGKDGEGSEVSDSSEEEVHQNSDDEETLIHHPFKIKEPPTTGIVMNIRNSKQLPVLTPLEKQAQKANLRLTFPVSSGSHHRASESEWVPVERPNPAPARPAASAPASSQVKPTPTAEPVAQIPVPQEPVKKDSIFPDPAEAQSIDIGTIISERLQAVRKLQQNPYDVQALSTMHKAQEQASKWATSKHLPGQFLGSTGAKVMSQAELIGDKKHQAWAKKTQLSQAAPVTGGIGMFLLQKMGWKHGEGLGKNNEGSKVPLLLDVKVDRKGLSAAVETPQRKEDTVVRAKDLSNKHPVSALMEFCNRRKWGPPLFTVVDESGPDHKKNFLFKVKVNNIEYQPTVPSANKKTAKAQCAGVCLQELGLIPRDAPLNI